MTPENPASPKSIVIVDDDRFLVDMYSVKFMQQGFSVEGCQSTREALAALRGGIRPLAILFDIIMPEQDGFDFLRAAKAEKLGEGAAFIALTNQSSDADRAQARELGADAYIVKASMIPSEVVAATLKEIEKRKSIT